MLMLVALATWIRLRELLTSWTGVARYGHRHCNSSLHGLGFSSLTTNVMPFIHSVQNHFDISFTTTAKT